MKITILTAGTGSYYCGACLRDNALARELLSAGHEVTLAPLYLPMMIDDAVVRGAETAPIFFGGINVYLQQKFALFRKTPALIDRLFNSHGLLRWAARHSHMTAPAEHGEMTLDMLNLESSQLQKESAKLFSWLEQEKPDLVCLSNALLAGFTGKLKRQLGAPVVTFFQGEDFFLDGLPEPWRAQCWTAMGQRLRESDLLISPSRFYADFMRSRLGYGANTIEVVPNGIRLEGLSPATEPPTGPPTIGYFAKLAREKGLELLVDAFLILTRELGDATTRLKIGGAETEAAKPLIADLKKRIAGAGLAARVEWSPNVDREAKIAFLRSLTLFSVPAIYAEAFGLYVLEAMACGIPVVQPDASAFPEIIAATGGGVCVPPKDPAALARAWQRLLAAPAERARLGRAGRAGVERHFSAAKMCVQFVDTISRLRPLTQPAART